MSSPFSPVQGNSKAPSANWSESTNDASTFKPFPSTTQSTVSEVGYGEGGYGIGGYDSTLIVSSSAPGTAWAFADNPISAFFPFPSSGQPTTKEVGYGEGGYGEDGYDSPGIPGSSSPTTNWLFIVTK